MSKDLSSLNSFANVDKATVKNPTKRQTRLLTINVDHLIIVSERILL